MKHHAILGSVLLACASLFGTSAFAADACAPLKLLTSVKMKPAGNDPGEVRLVPVVINDQTKMFLFDTGGALTQMSR